MIIRQLLILTAIFCILTASQLPAANLPDKFQPSDAHLAAANRSRRVVVNFDVIAGDRRFGGRDPAELVKWKFHAIDSPDVQIDSVWWSWGEGHQAPWPSKTMPLYDADGYRQWQQAGVDIVQVFLDAAKSRGIESFYDYRINGSDNDLGPVRKIPMKEKHPDWLIHTWNETGYFNFAIKGVRDYKLGILREIAERYDFDGIALDFARVCPVLPPGQAWQLREHLTQFMRELRHITLEVAGKRGRPLLIGIRIPENLQGCHFDGIDIESWVAENLIDILAPGVRSFDVDLGAFRQITAGTQVKLYPSVDDHHASDGYATPPLEIYRGVAANWLQQGADGVQVFNFNHAPDFPYGGVWKTHLAAYQQIGDLQTLHHKNKVFVVQRRGGGHGTTVVPNPEDWTTPRWMYFNTNMLAPLPASLTNDGKADTLLKIAVGDDLAAAGNHLESVELRLLLSDPAAQKLSADERLTTVLVAIIGHGSHGLQNTPPAKGIQDQIEVRINNLLLNSAGVQDGWLIFPNVPAEYFALGNNLIGVRVHSRQEDVNEELLIEKLEVHVQYQ